jgi:hypothetical protein
MDLSNFFDLFWYGLNVYAYLVLWKKRIQPYFVLLTQSLPSLIVSLIGLVVAGVLMDEYQVKIGHPCHCL